jgi:hypothetical protein
VPVVESEPISPYPFSIPTELSRLGKVTNILVNGEFHRVSNLTPPVKEVLKLKL